MRILERADADTTRPPYVLGRQEDSIIGDADTLGEATISKPKYGRKIPSELKKVYLGHKAER